jgi:hypothetical protein
VLSDPAYSFVTVNNKEHEARDSCRDLLESGWDTSGYYWLRTRFSNDTTLRSSFVGYCDQTTDGGGWLMCYTEDSEVDMAMEFGFRAQFPFGRSGYRSDCRNYAFNEVQYMLHQRDPSFDDTDRVLFKARSRRPVMISDSAWDGQPLSDAYGKLVFKAESSYSSPDLSTAYQLLACGFGRTAGLFLSGLEITDSCSDGWKTCEDWCKDKSSDYYRLSFSPGQNQMTGAAVNLTGVAFRENGFRRLSRKLISVGVRTAGSVCMAGWRGNGVQCTCPAARYVRSCAAYWRFEGGRDTATVRRAPFQCLFQNES